jgi:ketosteroid isomerase-like protein
MRALTLLALVLVLASAAAPGAARAQDAPPPATMPSVQLSPEMDRVLRDYERLWAAGDAAGLAALFTDDGFALQNGQPPVRGHAAIRQVYANARGPLRLRLRALASGEDGTVGYIIGAFAYGDAPGDMGKFVLTLRRGAGGPWRIVSDIDNSNRMPRMGPPPAQPPQP